MTEATVKILTCDNTGDDLVGEVGSNKDSREADTHLDPTKKRPQKSLQIPVEVQIHTA